MPAVAIPEKRSARWSDERTTTPVRLEIRKLLGNSEAFAKLSPAERKDLAERLVKVSSYLANPEGVVMETLDRRDSPQRRPLAKAQADPVDMAGKRAASSPGFAGKDFQAGA